MLMPRIKGKVGQADSPEEMKGKWFFEVWLVEMGAGEAGDENSLGLFGPWATEKIAQEELRKCVRLIADECERKLTGQVSGEYVDMKTNSRRKWDRSDEN